MGLLDRVLGASGGLDLWRQMRRFTVHMSIRGALGAARCARLTLPEFVVEGDIREPALEMIGFTALDLRALYRPDWTVLEQPDGRRLQERRAPAEELTLQLKSATWDHLQLAHFCGGLIWCYLTTPFVLAEPDFKCEELKSVKVQGQNWRRLRVLYPERSRPTPASRRFTLTGKPCYGGSTPQRFTRTTPGSCTCSQAISVIRVSSSPTLNRMLTAEAAGAPLRKPALLDVEIFEAQFK